tara:strand:+ start:66 stop:275 length:210 start_codon:yes stop_codon:yes gene_type:complete
MKIKKKYNELGQMQFLRWVIGEIELNGQKHAKWVQSARRFIRSIAEADGKHEVPKYKLLRFSKGENISL